jgi:hypothetical protein
VSQVGHGLIKASFLKDHDCTMHVPDEVAARCFPAEEQLLSRASVTHSATRDPQTHSFLVGQGSQSEQTVVAKHGADDEVAEPFVVTQARQSAASNDRAPEGQTQQSQRKQLWRPLLASVAEVLSLSSSDESRYSVYRYM